MYKSSCGFDVQEVAATCFKNFFMSVYEAAFKHFNELMKKSNITYLVIWLGLNCIGTIVATAHSEELHKFQDQPMLQATMRS